MSTLMLAEGGTVQSNVNEIQGYHAYSLYAGRGLSDQLEYTEMQIVCRCGENMFKDFVGIEIKVVQKSAIFKA